MVSMFISSVAMLSASVLTTLPDMTAYINQSAKTYTARGSTGWTGLNITAGLQKADGSTAPAWTSAGLVNLPDATSLWETDYEGVNLQYSETLFMDDGITVVSGPHNVSIFNMSVTELHSPPGLNLLSSIPLVLAIRNVAVYDRMLYIAMNESFIVFSLADPTSPEVKGNGKPPDFVCAGGSVPMTHFSVTKKPDEEGVYGTVVCDDTLTAIDFTDPNQMTTLEEITPADTFDNRIYCAVGFGATVYVVLFKDYYYYLYPYTLHKQPDIIKVDRGETKYPNLVDCLGGTMGLEEVIVIRKSFYTPTLWVSDTQGHVEYTATVDVPREPTTSATYFLDNGMYYGFKDNTLFQLNFSESTPTAKNISLYSGVAQRESGATEKIPWKSGGDIISCACKDGVLSILTDTKSSTFGVGLWLEMGVDGATTTNTDVSLVVKGKYAVGSAPDLYRTVHYAGYQPPVVTHRIGVVSPKVESGAFDTGLVLDDYFESLYPTETLLFEITGEEASPLPSWLGTTPLNTTNPYSLSAFTVWRDDIRTVCAGHDGKSLAFLTRNPDPIGFSASFYDLDKNYVFKSTGSIGLQLTPNQTAKQPFSSWRGGSGTIYASVIGSSDMVVFSYFWENETLSRQDELFSSPKFISGPFVIDDTNHALVLEEHKVYIAGVIGDALQIHHIYSTDSATLYILTSAALLKYRWGGGAFTLEKTIPIASADDYSCFAVDTTFQVLAMCKGSNLVLMGLEDAQVRGVYEGVEGEVLDSVAMIKAGVSVVTHARGARTVSWKTGLELRGTGAVSGEVTLVAKVSSSLGTVSNQTFTLRV